MAKQWLMLAVCAMCLASFALLGKPSATPTFYRNVLPILQQHCQSCHRAGEIGPMPLMTYGQVRAKVTAIDRMVRLRKMPPWFADPHVGRFANDPSLTDQEIETIAAWVKAGGPEGNPADAPDRRLWVNGWNIARPDLVIEMPKPVLIPAHGDVKYTYEIVPTGFTEDRWVQMSEIRPSSRSHVHHAVVYIRPPESHWLRNAPVGVPFTASNQHETDWTDSDMLLVYAPGSAPDNWQDGKAKCIPAGSDLVFQMHYTTNGKTDQDRTSVGIIFAKKLPSQRVITLQLTNDHFVIPPGDSDFRVESWGTLPNDATLLSFFPHMHLRGKRFEYNIVHEDGAIEPLLRVNYDFYWQLSYKLATPRLLTAGTKIQAVGWYDNSRRNPHNPDPKASVHWGDQTDEEMMVGFFDIAVPVTMDKRQYFIRP